TASCAAWYSFDLVRKYPLALFRIFLRRSLRLVPRFTRGMGQSPLRVSFGGWRQEALAGQRTLWNLFTRLCLPRSLGSLLGSPGAIAERLTAAPHPSGWIRHRESYGLSWRGRRPKPAK